MPVLREGPVFPPKATKKVTEQDYLSKKYFYQRNAAAFSNEDEDEYHVTNTVLQEEKPKDGHKYNLDMLTDDDLKAALLVYGVKAGPIVGSTRAVYERKLRRLQAKQNTFKLVEKVVFCPRESDNDSNEDSDSGSNQEDEQSEEQECSQVDVLSQDGHVYQQRFLPSPRRRFAACASKNENLCRKPTLKKVSNSTQSGRAVQIPKGTQSGASAFDQHSTLGSEVPSRSSQDSNCSPENFSITEMVEKMEKRMSPIEDGELKESDVHKPWTESNKFDVLVTDTRQSLYFTPKESHSNWETKDPMKDDLIPNIKPASTMISATCRRPIKGAAGRPVEFHSSRPPLSPTTLERREMERRMVPIQIQFVVFVVIALMLFVIVESEPLSPLLALTYNFMQGFINDAPVLQSTQTFLGHE
ncbi:lamina-associated polypeptide 2, isoforms beta/delta/epsilon/gamma-like isoform X2 [Hippocampus comes]|uniref:lamina-associated polypeptide 2, isoforms beta/delta/epsilon/gamma-like isoform X2 n=1 Tax=Hippocampus comes TaxID=109280 RepID=UPI00094EDC7C|nr:PREDICTED: lamina-associated polypeptide 2, isoforms beta/delta/epsilon/gamma-like isoform X2 [Hippocampus comes]